MSEKDKITNPIRETTPEVCRQVKELLRTARYGALATIDPDSGGPIATRVALATASDGAPLILVSGLTAHTRAMLADERVSLLVGEPGKGDPLAYPRATVPCLARRLNRDSEEGRHAARRYLNRNPKAKLYAGLGDFAYFRLQPQGASLNGGFGKAYRLTTDDILIPTSHAASEIEAIEQPALNHMNDDHKDAIDAMAQGLGGVTSSGWVMTGIDADGVDLALKDEVLRLFYPAPLDDPAAMRGALVALAKSGREALAAKAS